MPIDFSGSPGSPGGASLDFSGAPSTKPWFNRGVFAWLNRNVKIPQAILGAAAKPFEYAIKAGETAVRAAATVPLSPFTSNERRAKFIYEPWRKGGKTLAEQAIDIQARGEQSLPKPLRAVARAMGPTTAAGATLASELGNPANLGLAKVAMLAKRGVSLPELALGTEERPRTPKLDMDLSAAARSAAREAPMPTSVPKSLSGASRALAPREAKRLYKAAMKTYRRDLAAYEAALADPQSSKLISSKIPKPKPPEAPTFLNVRASGKRVITLGPEGSAQFPARVLEQTPVREMRRPAMSRETPDRIIEGTFGENAQAVKSYLSAPVKAADTAQAAFTTELKRTLTDTFKRLGIGRKSRESYLAGDFIEGTVKLDDLKSAAPKKWEGIVAAAEEGRKVYRDLLSRVNAVLETNGYKPIPERSSYITHTKQIQTWLDRAGTFLSGKADQLPTEIAGISPWTKPGRKFSPFTLRRRGGSTHEGLVVALDKYVDSIAPQIFQTHNIKRLRGVASFLQKTAEPGSTRLSNFRTWLEDWTNSLAGKTGMIDRGTERILGRSVLKAGSWLRRRTSANMVGGSVSSALTNYIPLTHTLATTAKTSVLRGLAHAFTAPFRKPESAAVFGDVRSAFLTRRFRAGRIGSTFGETVKDGVSWLFGAIDRFTSRTVVGAKYDEALHAGLTPEAAMAKADDYAARVIGDRSAGQVPLVLDSKTLGWFTQFQLEVNNQVSFILKDVPKMYGSKTRVAAALAEIALYSYLYNELFEKVAGRRPALDPIDVVKKTVETAQSGGDLADYFDVTDTNTPAGELMGGLPFVGTATGGRIPMGSAIPDVPGLLAGKKQLVPELLKPAYFLAPPTAGGQIKKSVEGLQTYARGYSRTPSGRRRFGVPQTVPNLLRMAVFGQYSTPEARAYFEKLTQQ